MRRLTPQRKYLLVALCTLMVFAAVEGGIDAKNTVIGYVETELEGSGDLIGMRETALGNFLADVMREKSGAEIALVNSQGVERGIEAGDVTIEDVLKMHPHRDSVVQLEMTGREIKSVIEDGLRKFPEPWTGFVQVSGIKYSFYPLAEPGERLREVTYEGEPVEENRLFTVATSREMASNCDFYEAMEEAENYEEKILIDIAVSNYLQNNSPVRYRREGRIRGTFR